MAAVGALSGQPQTAQADTIQVPSWYDGVPDYFRKNQSYFRNVVIEDLILEIGAPKSDLSEISIALVNKNSKPNKKKERPLVKITGPPCRTRWPNLHKTGDYPGVEGSTLGSASFSTVIYEGDVPDDLTKDQGNKPAKFPALEREQKAFFDFCERLYKHSLNLMYNDERIRRKQKDDALKAALKYVKNKEDKEQMAEIMEDVKQQFFDKANADDKKKYDFVRRDPEHYPGDGRYMLIKKAVASRITDTNKKLRYPPTGNADHYIDRLVADKKEYTPPCILLGNGKPIELGFNEEPVIENKDIVVPSIYCKVTDSSKGYGSRPLYSTVQLVRKARPEEQESVGGDLGDLAEEYDPFANKRKAEEPAPGANKKARTTPATGNKRKADDSPQGSNKKSKGEDGASGSGDEGDDKTPDSPVDRDEWEARHQ